MSVTVDATVGGPNSNSFQTVAEIDTYFLSRIPLTVGAQWTALSVDQKNAAAITATTIITNLVHWTHFPTTPTQALPWPQYGQWNRNGWVMVPLDVIPQELKNCHAEIALYLALEDRLQDFDPIKFGIQKIKVGTIDIQFHEKIPVTSQPQLIPDFFFDFLVPSWIDWIEDQDTGMFQIVRA